jgi:hypothetical protein
MIKIALRVIFLLPVQLFGWTTPVMISSSGQSPVITVDRRGWVHVAFYRVMDEQHFRCDPYYCYYNGTSWSTPINLFPDAKQANNLSICVDTLNRVHITWTDFGAYVGELYYTCYNGTTWIGPVHMADSLPNTSALGMSSLACDSSNNVHLVWQSYPETGNDMEIFYSKFDGDNWSHPINISNDPQGSGMIDLVIDKEQYLHVVWMDYAEDYGVRYSRYNGSSWSPSTLLPDPSRGQSVGPKIAVIDTIPHVVWEERAPRPGVSITAYTYLTDTGWATPETLSSPDKDAYFWDMVSDKNNRIHIVYNQHSSTNYIFNENGVWSIPDSIPQCYGGPALAIDNKNNVLHMVFQRAGTREIWYTKHSLPEIEEDTNSPVITFVLIVPSPISNKIELEYSLPKNDSVTLLISDILGRIIKKVNLGVKSAGKHRYKLKGDIECAGVYFITLKVGNIKITKKIIKFQ